MLKIVSLSLFLKGFLLGSQTLAQTSSQDQFFSGVFLSYSDFKKKKLTYKTDCKKEKNKFRMHDLFPKPSFDIIHKGVKHTHQKKDVYAYQDCEKGIYRFFEKEVYKIEEPGKIYIYSREVPNAQSKSPANTTVYYFSREPQGNIEVLSIDNLKKAYPENTKFHYLLDHSQNDNGSIEQYEASHGSFKVNLIYALSSEKNN